MAHFAKLDENNIVIHVVVGIHELGDDEDAHAKIWGGIWKRTSYNTSQGKHVRGGTAFRKNYAGIGFTYHADLDAFIPPKRFPSWILNEETCQWQAPVPKPDDGLFYFWDEESETWEPAA